MSYVEDEGIDGYDVDVENESETLYDDFTWTTKQGDCLFFRDMSDQHLINVYLYLENKGVRNKPFGLMYELADRYLIERLYES